MDASQVKKKFEAVAEHLIPEAARQKAYERPLQHINLVDVYGVMAGWETEELSKAANVETATTHDDVEAALAKRAPDSLLIRKSAGVSLESLAQLLRLSTVRKYVFLEQ